jgi:transcriptional regulator with XRE-family HTH domain
MDLGKKLKLLRGNMTQSELARRSRVDKAIISKIESGKMDGTVECHQKLAEVFGLKLSEFYAFIEEGKPEPAEFHSGKDGKTDTYQDFLEIITHLPLSKKMLPTFITLAPKEEKFLEETLKKVERFIIALDGEVTIEIESKIYNLKKESNYEKGDSLYSISAKRHIIKNTGTKVARILCISSPPVL